MFKKFKEGLLFGAGFGISFVLIWYASAYLVFPMVVGPHITHSIPEQLSGHETDMPGTDLEDAERPGLPEIGFYKKNIDEQIKLSSVIALARYEKQADGQMKAVIKSFLKKKPGTTIYYKVGDEYSGASYYPKDNTVYGDGVIIFFTGSPATMAMSVSYSGDRISGLGDIPIELFKDKCKGSES